MTNPEWEPIEGFIGPGEFERFVRWLDGQVESGYAEVVPCELDYGPGEVYGGRWFRQVETGETWRLVPPDPPFTGLWDKVR